MEELEMLELFEKINSDLNVIVGDSNADDELLGVLTFELAQGVTAERDAEIAELLPVPYTMKVPARAQLDGEFLRCPRVAYVDASKVPGEDWVTSAARGRRSAKPKTGVFMSAHTVLDIPDVVEIVRVAVLWRKPKS